MDSSTYGVLSGTFDFVTTGEALDEAVVLPATERVEDEAASLLANVERCLTPGVLFTDDDFYILNKLKIF